MNKKIIISLLSLLFSASAFGQTTNKKDTEILSTLRSLTDYQANFKLKELDGLLTADYIEISPAGEFDPRSKVLSFYSPEARVANSGDPPAVTISEHNIRYYGEIAIAIVRLDYVLMRDGKPLPPRSMRASFVLNKGKKAWKIVSAQYTAVRPPTPRPS